MASRKLPRPFTLPWGRGEIAEEASIHCPHWEPTLQLMEYEDGHRAIRFCYYHGPQFGRGPMILDETDLERLGKALASTPRLKGMMEAIVGSAGGGVKGVAPPDSGRRPSPRRGGRRRSRRRR